MISLQETGYLDTFTSLERRIFKKALIGHVNWVNARIASDLKQSGPCLCLHWVDAKWLNQHDKARRLRSGEKSLSCSEIKPPTAKVGRGLDRGRSANEPENVPQHNTNTTAARDPSKALHVCHKAQETVQIRARHVPCSSVERATEQAKEGKQHQYLVRLQSYSNFVLWWEIYGCWR